MSKYQKFVLQELPKASVVNLHEEQELNVNDDELINTAITNHLQKIVPDEEEAVNFDIEEELINIEQIKLNSYNQGFDDAKLKYESIIEELKSENSFADLLQDKIAEITSPRDFEIEVAKVTSQVIASIAKKIYLILPVDFEKVLRAELLNYLTKIYKEGLIKLTINPNRYDFCINILQTENLPVKFKENLQIIKDDNVSIDDCKLEWANTSLEYNQEQLSLEIEKILQQIKSVA